MITIHLRDEAYQPVFEDDVDPDRVHFYLLMPNVDITAEGPTEMAVPTGFTLPNGNEQPFLHVVWEDVTIE